MNEFAKWRAARQQLALERLGSDNPGCGCGETDPRCLQLAPCPSDDTDGDPLVICANCRHKQRPLPKSINAKTRGKFCIVCLEKDPRCLELHHIAGRQFADEVVVVCCNCHRKLSDMQKDHDQ
jgi:hypothetical protein